ncbi:MAG: prepilin-type N-terminal cleavage/methylation domain-containing protein [Verrucomicrobia bacterium]|nr:prepilin-type N-terminal cleavage/methylation domain-containing protein [Verrucomicrobiota bacterium]
MVRTRHRSSRGTGLLTRDSLRHGLGDSWHPGGRVRQSPFRASTGFTLLEILLAIAIIALIGTVLIGGGANLLAEKPATVDEVFDKAVQEARKLALKSGQDVRLAFKRDLDSRRFTLIDSAAPSVAVDAFAAVPDPNAGVLAEFPVPNAGDLEVTFLSTQKGGNMILVGGVAVETTTVPYATFYPDGTCSPFRAQFMRNGATHITAIDPWTCARMLKPVDPNAPAP